MKTLSVWVYLYYVIILRHDVTLGEWYVTKSVGDSGFGFGFGLLEYISLTSSNCFYDYFIF